MHEQGNGLFGASIQTKRVKKKRVLIKGFDGKEYLIDREEITFKDPVRGFVTLTNVFPLILKNGTKITSHLEIAGACAICQELVANSDTRICECGRLVCWEHSKYNNDEQKYFCPDCHKKLKRKTLISKIFKFLTSPFIEKVEEGN